MQGIAEPRPCNDSFHMHWIIKDLTYTHVLGLIQSINEEHSPYVLRLCREETIFGSRVRSGTC